MKTGIQLISDERARQIEVEGWTPEHDDEHDLHEMAIAAAIYAVPGSDQGPPINCLQRKTIIHFWPWNIKWYKPVPTDRVRELVKAGALIAAEIDRIQRQDD